MSDKPNIGVIHEVGDYGVEFGFTPLSEEEQKQVKEQNDRDKRSK